ncbi:DUF5916 domain-containing protein [Hyalangium versicolor]|uniref:DUF5916 domain-containing protein n=1 Tax=Hyalangium versicolor TaxID=2861190 RepID=UPI001CCA22EC|nr:DUF5916 domain-containing protein [Hyalangium versicolor]
MDLRCFRAALIPLLLLPMAASAAEELLLEAKRTTLPIQVDGKLDEAAWASAQVFDRFVQTFPQEGAAPSERTEVRILLDDNNLYVGVIAHDSRPETINRQLGRRDRPPQSDLISVFIDSSHDHRTAYAFSVNAGGILRDVLYFEDTKYTEDWDAVWDGAAAELPQGWSAELSIPLHLLRFSESKEKSKENTWGLHVRRELARTHEVIDSVLIPRNANAFVSRFGHLGGLSQLPQNSSRIDITPYVAARFGLSPQYSDPSRPKPRLSSPSADVGVDLQAALTSSMSLSATVNPDFGQIEADQLILNLNTFEQFFPEKRPFFLQGMDVFQTVGSESQQIFYSRRIGLETPILAAAKLTGNPTQGIQLGVLDAVVMGAANPAATPEGLVDEDNPDQRIRFHIRRPLHLGPNYQLPAQPGATRNFLAVVLRGQPGLTTTVGGTLATNTPLSSLCGTTQPEDPEAQDACRATGGNAAAVDWDVRSADSTWGIRGQLSGSHIVGGPRAGTILRDGTVLEPGDMGAGLYVNGGKQGGEPFRFNVSYEYASPRLELNATGFQPKQNEQVAQTGVQFVRPSGWGPLHDFSASVTATGSWSTDGRGIQLYNELTAGAAATLPGFHTAECEVSALFGRSDLREISQTGIAYERPPYGRISCDATTDPNRALSVMAEAYIGKIFSPSPLPSKNGGGASVTVTWRPVPRLETQLIGETLTSVDGPRWLGEEDGRHFFGQLNPRTLSLTLRQLLVLTPRLTLQAYAQVFSAYGRFGPFYEASAGPNRRLLLADLQPTELDFDPNFHEAALNLNLVLRWEYRLGSTLFFVYTRAQSELPPELGSPRMTQLFPHQLMQGPTTDMWLIKWSHQWGI